MCIVGEESKGKKGVFSTEPLRATIAFAETSLFLTSS